jgi:hypothetical protein
MAQIVLEQAVLQRVDRQPAALIGRSAGFQDEWVTEALQMALDFGDRPPGLACPEAIFAHPLVPAIVAVVRVRDVPGRTDELSFHFLVTARTDYEQFLGDPFALADLLPSTADASRALTALTVPRQELPPRTVQQVRTVLQRVKAAALSDEDNPEAPDFVRTVANSESPALLGGAQVLMDGGRLVFERPAGDIELVSGLWLLLPYGIRGRLWPASFAFANHLDFDVLVVPRAIREEYEGYTTEEQAAEYPTGSYELALQLAAESGDQHELDRVFERRSSAEVLRRTLLLLIAVLLIVLGGALLNPAHQSEVPADVNQATQAALAAGIASAGDPMSALGLYYYGKARWGRPGR